MILRDRQVEALHGGGAHGMGLYNAWEESQSALIVMATGMGKTILGAQIATDRNHNGRFVFIVDQIELAKQTRDKFARFGIRADIEMGDSKADALFRSDVVIMSVQTARSGRHEKRMLKFDPGEFSTMFVDEAHLSVSQQFKDVIAHFGSNPYCNIVGVTATPDRPDGKSLAVHYETCAFNYSMLDGIKDGYLVEPRQEYGPLIGVDFSQLKANKNGDFKDKDISEVIDGADGALLKMASGIVDRLGDQRTIVFTASVDHAKRMSDFLNAHRPGSSAWVCGETDRDERSHIMDSFSDKGDTQYLCNYGITTKGYDNYTVTASAILRPTKSRSLYEQMIGRLTRPWEGKIDGLTEAGQRLEAIANSNKPFATVLDFPGNSGKHKIIGIADVLAGTFDEETIVLARTKSEKKIGPIRMRDELEEAEREMQMRRQRESEERQKLKVKAEYEWSHVSLFEGEQRQSTQTTRYYNDHLFSDKQKSIFANHGIDISKHPSGYLKKIIPKLLQEPSVKQRGILTGPCQIDPSALATMKRSEWQPIIDNYFAK